MGGISDLSGIDVYDHYGPTTTFEPGTVDKLDVLPADGGPDVLVQFTPDGGTWLPPEGVRLPAGLFQSLTGLHETYPPGPRGYRLRSAQAGTTVTMKLLRAWLR